MKKIIYLLFSVMGITLVLSSCSSDEATTIAPPPPVVIVKMPEIGNITYTSDFSTVPNSFSMVTQISIPVKVYDNTPMESVVIYIDSTGVPSATNYDYKIDIANVIAPVGGTIETTLNTSFPQGKSGDFYNIVLSYTSNNTPLITPVKEMLLRGYKRGQRLFTDGTVAPNGTPTTQINSVVCEALDNGRQARILAINEKIDPTAPSLQRPGWDFENYNAGTSTAAGQGLANTIKLKNVLAAQVANNYINPYGAAKLCYNAGNNSYLPSKGDWERLVPHLKTIFKDQAFYGYVINGKSFFTSSEVNATNVWTISFSSWTTIQNGTASTQSLITFKNAHSAGWGDAVLSMHEILGAW